MEYFESLYRVHTKRYPQTEDLFKFTQKLGVHLKNFQKFGSFMFRSPKTPNTKNIMKVFEVFDLSYFMGNNKMFNY